MTSNTPVDSLESNYSRNLVTPNRLSLPGGLRKSSSKGRRQSLRKLYSVTTDFEEPVSKRQRLSVASTNATLGDGSALEESLSILDKTSDEASPLFRTGVRQMQITGFSKHMNAEVSCSGLNKISESKNNNQKPLSCIPHFSRSNSENSCDSSPDTNIKIRKVNTPVNNCTPPNRILSSAKNTVTPSSSVHKTPRSNLSNSYNDSPLSIKMLKSKHEALNALHNIMFAKSTGPQVSGIRKLQCMEEESDSKINTNRDHEVQDDLPKTQPATTVLMHGVIAFVDVRNGGDNRSEGVKSHLRELGATILDKFTKEVTHVVFMDGLMSTYKKAIQRKIPLVSVLWIEACKEAMERVPESLYPPHQMEKYESPDPLKKFRRERSFQPDPDENIEDWLEKCKLKRRKKKLVIEEKENEEFPLPEVLRNRPAWLNGNLEQALRSIADVGPEYDEYINRSTSPTLSEEESFDTPLAVRLMRKIRHAEEVKPENAVLEKSLDEPGASKRVQANEAAVNLETPHRSTRADGARKSICFTSSETSDNEQGPPVPSPTLKLNLSKIIQHCIKNQTKSNALPGNKDVVNNGLKDSAVGRIEANDNKSLKSKSKPECSKVNDETQDIISQVSKENSSSMELTPDIRKKQNGDMTNLSCDISTCSLATNARAKRRLMPLTQPEVLEGDISEYVAPSQCPYNLDSPKNRKRKRIKSPEKINNSRRVNNVCNVQRNKEKNSRRSLEDFVVDANKPKKDQPNVTTSLPTMVGTGLHTPELELIASVIEKLGGFTLAPKVVGSTTHIIAPGPRRTINLLKGMIRGCWIVTQEWVLRSLEAGYWIEEEPFELTAFSPAVQENRVERLSFGPQYKINIFKECGAMYVHRFSKPPKEDLEDLITMCGGKVVKSVHHALLVVGKGPQKKHACCVKEIWILDCITCNELKPLDSYLIDGTAAVAVKSNKK